MKIGRGSGNVFADPAGVMLMPGSSKQFSPPGSAKRFTADRLIAVLNRLGSSVEVKVRIRPLPKALREILIPATA